MIAQIEGKVVEIGDKRVVVSAGGVGYLLFVTDHTASRLSAGAQAALFVKQIVRENEIALYGFSGAAERRLFELLISTSGLGPKLALSLLDDVGEAECVEAILSNDSKTLTRAAGIGAKLAQKICLELGDRMREEALQGKVSPSSGGRGLSVVVDALVALGVRRSDAEAAAAKAREEADGDDAAVLIPIALKYATK